MFRWKKEIHDAFLKKGGDKNYTAWKELAFLPDLLSSPAVCHKLATGLFILLHAHGTLKSSF